MKDEYKVKQLTAMLSHEEGVGDDIGYGAHLSHWYGDSKPIQLDAGAIKVLISYYGGGGK
jgi:hypothetical protein